jgi:hypothetical protein
MKNFQATGDASAHQKHYIFVNRVFFQLLVIKNPDPDSETPKSLKTNLDLANTDPLQPQVAIGTSLQL